MASSSHRKLLGVALFACEVASRTHTTLPFSQPREGDLIIAEVAGADSDCKPLSPPAKGKKTKANPTYEKKSQPLCQGRMETLKWAPGALITLGALVYDCGHSCAMIWLSICAKGYILGIS